MELINKMTYLKRILLTVSIIPVWVVLWIFLSAALNSVYSNFFNYSAIIASWQQCLSVNALRSFNYLILFCGQMLIIKWAFRGEKLSQMFNFRLIRNQLKEFSGWNTLKLLLANLVWVIYWITLSLTLFFFSVSHFMGDCDDGDLECSCNNLQFLMPVFVITMLLGLLFISRLCLHKADVKK